MKTAIKRPGGELATRPLHFFWIVDCSGSMTGEKIGTVNNAIQSVIPEMVSEARDNPNAQLYIRTLSFSSGAKWITEGAIPVEDYAWDDLQANGVTDMGAAFNILCAELEMPPMPERALPPVLVNAVVIGFMLHYQANEPLAFAMLTVGGGQALAVYVLGIPLQTILRKRATKW